MDKIPTENHIRSMLDPVPPETLFAMFGWTLAALEKGGGLGAFERLGGHVLIALDGTENFCSQKIECPNCSSRARANGRTEHFHAMVSAALVAPGHERALPLVPEFIAPRDGAEKQDCEARAAHRWLAAHGPKYSRLKPIYLGDDLSSRQATCEAVRALDAHFLFTAKPSSHKTLYSWLDGAEVPAMQHKIKQGARFVAHRYRWMTAVPLRDGKDAMLVNWLEFEIVDPTGKVTYRNSFVTDLPVSKDNVAQLAACGRARWKIENESFNTLKTKGYNLEHNFGHGQQHLAAVLATMNLLAFAGRRSRRPGMEGGKGSSWHAQAPLRGPASHHHLSGVPDLGRPGRDATAPHSRRQPSATAETARIHPDPRTLQPMHCQCPDGHNENCCWGMRGCQLGARRPT